MTPNPLLDERPTPPAHPRHGKAAAVYWYTDDRGQALYAVCRFATRTGDGKTFLQGRPTSAGGWAWGLGGLEPVLYRLPQLARHLGEGRRQPLWLVEGEKDVHTLLAHDPDATVSTTPMGSHKWRESYSEYLQGIRLVHVVADNDEPGKAGAFAAAAELRTLGAEVHLWLPAVDTPKADLTDHLEAGLDLQALRPLLPEVAAGPLPLLVDAYEFAAMQTEPPEALWGSPAMAIIPAGGLTIFAGRPGTGKTTLLLDLCCALAGGEAYPPQADDKAPTPYPCPRPLRIAIIENEGPQEMFRDKLARKLAKLPYNINERGGALYIQAWRWGAFNFADPDAFQEAERWFAELDIDLVVGDPLQMMGVEGVGSPADTRQFVQILRRLGLGAHRSFMFLHHFRERAERTEDEMARISGAWAGHLDTLITLSAMGREEHARLAFPKVRWARQALPDPIVLGRVYNTSTFEALRSEGDHSLLEPVIAEHLGELRQRGQGYGGKGWVTYATIAKGTERRRNDVKHCLEGAPHLFVERLGEDAKALGAKSNSRLWGLTTWDDAPQSAQQHGPAEPEQQQLGTTHDDIPF